MKKQPWLSPEFKAAVLFQDKKYSVEQYINNNTGKPSLAVVTDKTHIDYVVVYSPDRIAFDNPLRLPERIKQKVRNFAKTLKAN